MKRRDTTKLATAIRKHALEMVYRVNASHIGTCLSMADLLAVIYGNFLRIDAAHPASPDRDRFLLSKGHGAAALYATLAETGFIPHEWLDRYCLDGSCLPGHVTSHGVPGVEISTGSLGHGLGIGCGLALNGKRAHRDYRVCVLLSDGECDEGSIWEAALFAPHHRLTNLIAIVDYNKIQSFGSVKGVLDLEPLAAKWEAFGWGVREINGHDHDAIAQALHGVPFLPDKPSVIIAHTIKGKGISFMENQLAWHYKSPNADQLKQAMAELGCQA